MFNSLSRQCVLIVSLIYVLNMVYPSVVYSADDTLPTNDTQSTDDTTPLANGFFNVELGFTFDEVVAILQNEPLLVVLEEPEIFVVPESEQKVIRADGVKDDATGYRFIQEAFFQFNDDDRLVVLSMSLNTNSIDYFSLFELHNKKYGNANVITPNKAQWNNESTTLIIERPLTVKYIMNSFIRPQQDQYNTIEQQAREQYREDFLSFF